MSRRRRRQPSRLLRSNEDFLQNLPELIEHYGETDVARGMSCCQLKCMSEIVHNLRRGNIPINLATYEKLQPYSERMKQLGCKSSRTTVKRRLLCNNKRKNQFGSGPITAGLLTILASTVLPYVLEFISR